LEENSLVASAGATLSYRECEAHAATRCSKWGRSGGVGTASRPIQLTLSPKNLVLGFHAESTRSAYHEEQQRLENAADLGGISSELSC
jgi:hypothetical protein